MKLIKGTKMQVANEILKQMGGNKFLAMTGASNLLALESGLQFKIPTRLASNKANIVRIVLDSDDTYTMTFYKFSMKKASSEILSASGLFCDNIMEFFTDATGIYIKL